LTISSSGELYATDSLSPAIYIINKGSDELKLWLDSKKFSSPQGLALTPDGKFLFYGGLRVGVFRSIFGPKKTLLIGTPENSSLLGIDGLYFYKGQLIAVQNA